MSLASPGGRSGAVEAIERILNRESEADVILRQAVTVLAERLEAADWVGVAFVEEGALELGPAAGDVPAAAARPSVHVPVRYRGTRVAEIWVGTAEVATTPDVEMLDRAADLLSPYCLVGWDTGGEEWVNE